jgi:F-type H+-transporting ATPase subunit delta
MAFPIDSYAQALASLGREQKKLPLLFEHVENLLDQLRTQQTIITYLADKRINKKEKKHLLYELVSGYDVLIFNFINVVWDNNGINELIPILENFLETIQDDLGIIIGRVLSSDKLTKEEIKALEDKLESQYHKKAILTNRVVSDLIGGIKVLINNKVIDHSLIKQLDELKSSLNRKELTL